MLIGEWRIRPRWRRRHWGTWLRRDRYAEGDVFRVALGWWQVTVMVDRMSTRERTLHEQRVQQTLAEFTNET